MCVCMCVYVCECALAGARTPAARACCWQCKLYTHCARSRLSSEGRGGGREASEDSKVVLGHLFVLFHFALLLLVVVVVVPESGLEPAG